MQSYNDILFFAAKVYTPESDFIRTYEQFLVQNGKIFESCLSGLYRLGG